MKLKYSFSLKKQAVVQTPHRKNTFVDIGEVISYSDINGAVFVQIELKDNLPKQVVDFLVKNPKLISIVGQPSNISEAELTDTIIIPK